MQASVSYARQSDNGRITLVITNVAKPLRTLWALMATDELNPATESSRIRKGIGKNNIGNKISSVTRDEETTDQIKLSIKDWLINMNESQCRYLDKSSSKNYWTRDSSHRRRGGIILTIIGR